MALKRVSKNTLVCALSLSILCGPLLFPKMAYGAGVVGLHPAAAVPVVLPSVNATHSANLAPTSVHNSATGSSGNTNLDLSSVTASIQTHNTTPISILIGGSLSHGSISGGSAFTVDPGQLVTPAQYAAVYEALHGSQTLLLNAQGAAVGGLVNLNSSRVASLSSLVVPKGVTADVVGYTSAHPLTVSGALDIYGSLYALQNAPGLSSSLNLASLLVGSGALLSANLPSGNTHDFASSGLTLNLTGNLLNQGTIQSHGTLTVNAGGDISNVSTGNTQASILASNINLNTGSGIVNNSGLIQAQNTLNLNTLSSNTSLTVNNIGGTLSASGLSTTGGAGGVINVLDASKSESANVTILGGTLNAPGGINVFGQDMEVHVDDINGAISNTGSVAHVSVESGDLVVGQQKLTGDPTYFNTDGDVTLASSITAAGDIAVAATGNIITTTDTSISTTSANSSVFLIAGYNFLSNGHPNGMNDTSTTLTFDGTAAAGVGNINASGYQLNISTSGSGTVSLISTGSVNLGAGTISTGNGNVLIIGGTGVVAAAGSSIQSTSGSVTIASSNVSGLGGMTILNGTVSPMPTQGSTPSNGALTIPAVNTGGDLSVSTSGNISSPYSVVANNVSLSTAPQSSGTINISGTITGNASVSVVADGSLTINNAISSPSTGTLTLTSNSSTITSNTFGTITSGGAVNITTNSQTTNAGNINLRGAIDNSAGDRLTLLATTL